MPQYGECRSRLRIINRLGTRSVTLFTDAGTWCKQQPPTEAIYSSSSYLPPCTTTATTTSSSSSVPHAERRGYTVYDANCDTVSRCDDDFVYSPSSAPRGGQRAYYIMYRIRSARQHIHHNIHAMRNASRARVWFNNTTASSVRLL